MIRNIKKLFHLPTLKPKQLFSKIQFSYGGPKKKRALTDPFHYQEIKIKQTAEKDNKKYGYLQFGMYGLVIACCFAAIPLYRIFCEHVGIIGNYQKKTYEFKPESVRNLKKYTVKFEGQAEPGINWQFEPVEQQVIVGPSETAIVFYRLYNKEDKPIVGFSTYNISPEQANIYFSKIQCFCFNQQMVNPKEELLLPIFFYLEPELADDPDVGRIRQIKVHYDFIRSAKQDLAKFAAEQIRKMQENKKKLKQIRAKKNNMTLEQYQEYMHGQELKKEQMLHQELQNVTEIPKKSDEIIKQQKSPASTQSIESTTKDIKETKASIA